MVGELVVAEPETIAPDEREARRNRLVLDNLKLVYRAARRVRVRAPHVLEEDLIGAGVVGLLGAAERFDPARGHPIQAFVIPRIRGAILDHMRQMGGWRRPAIRARRVLKRAESAAQRGRLRQPGVAEIAAELGVPLQRYWALRDGAVTREVPYAHGAPADDLTQQAVLNVPDPDARRFERRVEDQDLLDRVYRAMRRLQPNERAVLHAHYIEGLPYRVIGRQRGVTESRACQIARQAIRRLRAMLADAGVLTTPSEVGA